jgi:hypothetical protein
MPSAIAYDLVLEDHILARQKVKRTQRPFTRELAEMVRYAVGYKSRAFVTFGQPIQVKGYDPQARRDVLELAHHVRDTIGRLMKVVPTPIVAACMRPSIPRADLKARVAGLIGTLVAAGANMATTDPDEAIDTAADLFDARGIIVVEGSTFRVRDRNVLKYYAQTIEHLLPVPPDKAH